MVVFALGMQFNFAQTTIVVDTVYNVEGTAHYLMNYKESQQNHMELALKCKEKADSLLLAHFDPQFFKDHILLNAEDSNWSTKDTSTPEEVALSYTIVNSRLHTDLIAVKFSCKNGIRIIETSGVPSGKNYSIVIDYEDAKQLAEKKGFKAYENSEPSQRERHLEKLVLEYIKEKNYQWVIHKNIHRTLSPQQGRCSFITYTAHALYINAVTGKTKKKKERWPGGSVLWF